MKKYSIKIAIVFASAFVLLCILSAVFFVIISDRISSKKISENLDVLAVSASLSITTKMETDYNDFKTRYDDLDASITTQEERVEALKTQSNAFFEHFNGSYGGYTVKENGYVYYLIDGKEYIRKNAGNDAESEKQPYNFCNFCVNFDCEGISDFTNPKEVYAVFHYQDVIMYFNARSYLSHFYENNLSLKIDNYAIVSLEDFIYFHSDDSVTTSSFRTFLVNKNNSEYYLDTVLSGMKDLAFDRSITDKIKMGSGADHYFTISRLTNWDNDYDMFLVQFYPATSVKRFTNSFMMPLIVILLLLILVFLLFVFLVYRYLHNKYEATNTNIIHRKNFGYQIRVARDGSIMSYDKNMTNLLTDVQLYHNLSDFALLEKHPDIKTTLTAQEIITICLSPTENIQNKDLYLRFTVLKGFDSCLLVGCDDTENIEQTIKYRQKALYNPVTKHANADMLAQVLDEYIATKKVKHELANSVVVAVRVKKFASYEELFGPEISDKLMIKICEVLTSLAEGKASRVYQLKDDTFALYLEKVNNFNETTYFIEKLLDEFNRPVDVSGNTLILEVCCAGFNIDLNSFPNVTGSAILDSLYNVLNKIMGMKSKKYEVFDAEYGRTLSQDESLSKDIGFALANNEFYMALQPQYSHKLQRVVGLEALIRWNNPKYENSSSQKFIELAERNGMIIPIGNFILDKTFEYAKLLQSYELTVSVNISPAQVLQAGFISNILKYTEKHDIIPEKIVLEITETFLMDNYDLVIQKLNILKREGFHIHLDDFGTGHSSLLYLKNLPIDAIKIDKGFIDHVVDDNYSRSIVELQINMAQALGLELVAEGVEQPSQYQVLVKSGCDVIQGYLIAKAMPFDDCVAFLEDQENLKKLDEKIMKNKMKKNVANDATQEEDGGEDE